MRAADFFADQSFHDLPARPALAVVVADTLTYDRYDEDEHRWRHYRARRNPATGVYDLDIVETNSIGIPLSRGTS